MSTKNTPHYIHRHIQITRQLSRIFLYASAASLHLSSLNVLRENRDPKTTLLSFPPFSNQASYECYYIPRISGQSRRFGNAIKQNSDIKKDLQMTLYRSLHVTPCPEAVVTLSKPLYFPLTISTLPVFSMFSIYWLSPSPTFILFL